MFELLHWRCIRSPKESTWKNLQTYGFYKPCFGVQSKFFRKTNQFCRNNWWIWMYPLYRQNGLGNLMEEFLWFVWWRGGDQNENSGGKWNVVRYQFIKTGISEFISASWCIFNITSFRRRAERIFSIVTDAKTNKKKEIDRQRNP